MKHHEFEYGEIVALTADAPCIPAGCYRFLEEHGGIIRLAIDQVATVGLNARMWRRHIKPARGGDRQLLSAQEFSKRHRRLLEGADNQHTRWESNPDNSYCLLFLGSARGGATSSGAL
jgi:hypothetical protein